MRDAGRVTDEKLGCFVPYRVNEPTPGKWRRPVDEFVTHGWAGEPLRRSLDCGRRGA